MIKLIRNNKVIVICAIALLFIVIPYLFAIKFAIFTPEDFGFAMSENIAGNQLSVWFGKVVNPVKGLNYHILRVLLAVLFVLFVISFFCFVYFLLKDCHLEHQKACIYSTLIVSSFLFFKEYYELFFWWTGAVFYELPIMLLFVFITIYLVAKNRNKKWLKTLAVFLVCCVIIANFTSGTFYWLQTNKDEDLNIIKATYYTLCVVEGECKQYIKSTGFILVLCYFFCSGFNMEESSCYFSEFPQKWKYIILPFVSIYPLIYGRGIWKLESLPNRGEGLLDICIIIIFSLVAIYMGVYARNKINCDVNYNIFKGLFFTCAIVFVVNFSGMAEVRICKNLAEHKLQEYSNAWASIYWICENSEEPNLVIETSLPDHVEGCCIPKIRTKTNSEQNEMVSRWFDINSVSLNNNYGN